MRAFSLALMFILLSGQPPAEPERFAPSAAEGRRLIVAYGCLGCHAIPGFTGIAFRGPALANTGGKLRPEWLRTWLHDPSAVDPNARMANFNLTDRQVEGLEAFLMSQQVPAPRAARGDAGDPRSGQALFTTLACHSCHAPSPSGFAGLVGLNRKVRAEWLRAFLADPPGAQPGTPMRAYGLSRGQLDELTAFLLEDGGGHRVKWNDAAPWNAGAASEGRAEFERLSCTSCHRLDGMPEPRLTGLPVTSRDVAWKLMTPASFAGSDMPAFHLSWKDATSIELAVRNPE